MGERERERAGNGTEERKVLLSCVRVNVLGGCGWRGGGG